jgi:PEP-CTERM motif
MKTLLVSWWLALLSCTAIFGAPCVPGNYQSFVNLGAPGCEVETIQFANFTILPGQTIGTPIDPAQVQVAPGGTALNPMFLFTLNTTAAAGEVFESFFRFSASGSLFGASIGLTPPTVTGDAAVTGILDVCPDGSFAGGAPLGCPTSPASLVVFAIDQSSLLSGSANLPVSSFFDVFVDLTIDGGLSGSATLGSATVGFSSVPEPSAGLLVALGLSAFGVSQARRRRFSGEIPAASRRNSRFDPPVIRGADHSPRSQS